MLLVRLLVLLGVRRLSLEGLLLVRLLVLLLVQSLRLKGLLMVRLPELLLLILLLPVIFVIATLRG